MKYLSKLIMAIMAVPAFTIAGCSGSDVSDPDGSRLPENAMVYINVDVQLPDDADTRANTRNSSTTDPDTSSDGEEGGTDAENAIHSALIILKGDGANIHAEVVKMASKDGGYTLTAVVPLKKALEFGNKMQNKPFNLYVVANPGYETITRPMLGYDVENYIATVSGLDSPYLTTVNGLPMSNFEEYTFTIDEAWTETFFADFLSDTSSLDLNRYNDNKSITLERSVARIDYRDKERNDDDPDGKNPHEYKIGESGYTVKIVGMCPVNVSKNFYTFRHIWVKPESGTPYLDFLVARQAPTISLIPTTIRNKEMARMWLLIPIISSIRVMPKTPILPDGKTSLKQTILINIHIKNPQTLAAPTITPPGVICRKTRLPMPRSNYAATPRLSYSVPN